MKQPYYKLIAAMYILSALSDKNKNAAKALRDITPIVKRETLRLVKRSLDNEAHAIIYETDDAYSKAVMEYIAKHPVIRFVDYEAVFKKAPPGSFYGSAPWAKAAYLARKLQGSDPKAKPFTVVKYIDQLLNVVHNSGGVLSDTSINSHYLYDVVETASRKSSVRRLMSFVEGGIGITTADIFLKTQPNSISSINRLKDIYNATLFWIIATQVNTVSYDCGVHPSLTKCKQTASVTYTKKVLPVILKAMQRLAKTSHAMLRDFLFVTKGKEMFLLHNISVHSDMWLSFSGELAEQNPPLRRIISLLNKLAKSETEAIVSEAVNKGLIRTKKG